MTILAVGYTPNDFTGWGGEGSPVYTEVDGSWTGTTGAGNIKLTHTLAINTSGVGHGCAWLPFTQSLNTFSVFFDIDMYGAGDDVRGSAEPVIIHTAAMDGWIVLKHDSTLSSTDYWPMYWYLTSDLLDTTKYIKISPYMFNGYLETWRFYCLEIENAGTTDGVIRFYQDTSTYVGTLIGTWTGDLTDYKDFDAISFHAPTPYTQDHMNIGNVVVSDSRLRAAWCAHYIYNSDAGTYSEWLGSASYFTTVPSVYSSYGSGYYASTVGARLTFGVENTEIPNKIGFQIYEVRTVANMRGGYDTTTSVAPYLYNAADETHVIGNAVDMDPDGKTITFSYPVNPVTGLTWTLADLEQYEFGLIRTE